MKIRKIETFFNRMFCNLKAIPAWLDTGWWLPHTYVEITPLTSDKTYADVYVSNHGVRMKNIYNPPNPDEILIEKAPIRRFNCKKCGKTLIVFNNTWGEEYINKGDKHDNN